MECPVDETVLFDANQKAVPDDAAVECFLSAEQFVDQGGRQLAHCLGETKAIMGMVQGSRFCCAVTYDEQGYLVRGLVSPEELSVNMALRLLHGEADV